VAARLDRSSGPQAVNRDSLRDCRGRPDQDVGSCEGPSVVRHLDWD
jgi:hypothetical protein